MELILDNLTRRPEEPEEIIFHKIHERFRNIHLRDCSIIRRGLDARKKQRIVYTYRVKIIVDDKDGQLLLKEKDTSPHPTRPVIHIPENLKGRHYIIVGSGPAGLFAALRLVHRGAQVTILERGNKVKKRMSDIAILEQEGILNPESNVVFGEGGAGTYSDGKLTTRTNRPEIEWVYDMLRKFGIDDDVLINTRPHVGTDRLQSLLLNIRQFIEEQGSRFIFNQKVNDFIINEKRCRGVLTEEGNEFTGDGVLLATGHSARDIYELLESRRIPLEHKNFALGFRIEHPVELINSIQYGKDYGSLLPTAEYRLTWNNASTSHGVYSFCMCPGGQVINSASEPGMLCINGMSYSGRDSRFSNSALVVTVTPNETGSDLFSGVAFQRNLEQKAWDGGGGDFSAPAQRVTSFLEGRLDTTLPATSFLPGVRPARLDSFLSDELTNELVQGILSFNRKMKGFIMEDALLLGMETRTSSPLRILRDRSYQSPALRGLYPIGEGSGYSGGIISSAVDGIKCADSIKPD